MDPFSSEGELVNIHTAFVQGQYQSVLNDYTVSDFSPENALPIRILQYRAQCALGQYNEVLSSLASDNSSSSSSDSPDLAAVRLYASSYLQPPSDPTILTPAEELASTASENLTVQLLVSSILSRAGKPDAALQLLSSHTGSLDAVALSIQICLQQNNLERAIKEAKAARSFAQDALLVNLAEAWIAMRMGGEANYQKAFYVFEEMAQGPSSRSVVSLVQQGVSELHLGRVEEAEVALGQAWEMEEGKNYAAAVVNKLVLDVGVGREGTEELTERLKGLDKECEFLVELEEKRSAFEAAMAKYNPKFEP
ncbi:Coatomer subunit epsilon [Sphaerulina musiva]